MEVRPGYKLTESGVIPQEWESIAADGLVEPTAPICYGVVQVGEDTYGGVPIVAIKYVKEIASAPLHRTSVALEQPYARSRVRGGDVLISVKGTIGRVGIVPDCFVGNISRELARLRPRPEFSGEYIGHQLESDGTQARISRVVVGTTRLEFSIATLRSFQLPVPQSLPEQRAIAAALSDVDALLDGLERLIAKKRDLKQAAMQQLLTGQTRLPGFHGEWVTKELGSDVALSSGHHVLARYCNTHGEGTPYLTGPADFKGGQIQHSKFTVKPGTLCEAGDILVTVKGSGAGSVAQANSIYCISRQLMAIRTTQWNTKFLFYSLLQSGSSLVAAKTGLIPGLSRADILEQVLPIPSDVAEQIAIAAVLSDMDAELAALETRRDKTRALKQGMMQELLTGRTRLVTPDEAERQA